jgi:small-conductance mechanosensitive channel
VRTSLALLGALCVLLSFAFAYDAAVVGTAQRTAEQLRVDLDRIAVEIAAPAIDDERLTTARTAIEDIRTKALSSSETLVAPIAEVTQQIDQLGPVPAEGASEAADIAEQRKKLTGELNGIQGTRASLELIAIEAEQLAGRVSIIQREQFFSRIFEAGRSILNPLLWLDTGIGFGLLVKRILALYSTWWNDVRATANFSGLVLIPAMIVVLTGLYLILRGRMQRWFDAQLLANRAPDEMGRLWRIVRALAAAFAALVIIILPISIALGISGFLTPRFELVFNAVVDVVFITVIYWVLARRVAAPGQPAWRVIDIDDAAASRLPLLVGLAALVTASSQSLAALASSLFLPITYTVGQSAMAAIALYLLISIIVLTLKNQQGAPGKTLGRKFYFNWAGKLVPLVWLAIIVGVAALLFGYVALAAFLAEQMYETAILIITLFLLHHLSDAAVTASFDPASGFGRFLRRFTGFGERAIERMGLVFRTLVDLLLVLAGLPLLFLLWTVTWVDFRAILNSAFFGFKIGDITISPWSLLLVAAIFIGGIILTKLLIRWLDSRILSQTRVDKGVQDSLRKGGSYLGYILAALLAFGAAGIDLSSLAIVAGALGIGVGLGLQPIVNNFVSGLILLIERPVRVGDWVVLDSGEGLVKRINVRTTEIETFDQCTLIVPNSMMAATAVKNWTHDDGMGRFLIAVSVALDSDAEKVRDTLVEVARSHPKVLTYPEPVAILAKFGQWSLDFEMRPLVADVFDAGNVASDIRFALLKAFAEKGITIATPPASMQFKA